MRFPYKIAMTTALVLLFVSCALQEKIGPVEAVLSDPGINKEMNVVFLVLFPDDCPNCYNNAGRHLNYLTAEENFPSSNLIIVMPDVRQKVKEHFFLNILPFDTTRHPVIEDNSVISELKKIAGNEETAGSFVAVYSAAHHFTRARQLKSISSHEELLSLLK